MELSSLLEALMSFVSRCATNTPAITQENITPTAPKMARHKTKLSDHTRYEAFMGSQLVLVSSGQVVDAHSTQSVPFSDTISFFRHGLHSQQQICSCWILAWPTSQGLLHKDSGTPETCSYSFRNIEKSANFALKLSFWSMFQVPKLCQTSSAVLWRSCNTS